MVRAVDSGLFITAALRNVRGERVVLDSVRYRSDIDRVHSAGFVVWHIECSPRERERRLKNRGQAVTSCDFEHPSERELSASEFEAIIANEDLTEEELHSQIDLLLRA
jgi:dephospho-CoA kinase